MYRAGWSFALHRRLIRDVDRGSRIVRKGAGVNQRGGSVPAIVTSWGSLKKIRTSCGSSAFTLASSSGSEPGGAGRDLREDVLVELRAVAAQGVEEEAGSARARVR